MHCDTRCVLADIGLGTQTNGNATICNQSRTAFRDIDGNTIRLDTHSLEQAWNSPTRKEIASALANGQRHENCYDCWFEEDAGRASMRQLSNEKFSEVTALDQPRVFMFKPGNACNLSCRHCNPFVSSKWYRDHYQVMVKPNSAVSFNEYVRSFDSIKQSFAKDNVNLWPILQKWSKDLVFIDLYGAEPLLIDPLLQTLRHSYNQGYSKNQTIHINTNGTIWHDDFNEVFSSYEKIELGISIDGIAEQFEYMRYPAKWSLVLSNIEKYRQLAKTYKNIEVSICITVSLLNIYYLPEYVNFFHSMGLDCGVNILHRPEYLNVRIAPPGVKQKIVDKMESAQFYIDGWDTKIADVTNFVLLPLENSTDHYNEFWNFTDRFDKLRNQSFAQTFSEFYDILKNE